MCRTSLDEETILNALAGYENVTALRAKDVLGFFFLFCSKFAVRLTIRLHLTISCGSDQGVYI